MNKYEYRLVWKRQGCPSKNRRFARQKSAEKYALLFTNEPWKYIGKGPDEYVCCSGYQCGCQGLTYMKQMVSRAKDLPSIEFVRIEKRQISEWEKVSEEKFEVQTKDEILEELQDEVPF